MGRAKKTKKFATMKRMISASDPRLKDKEREKPKKAKKEDPNEIKTTEHVQSSSALFFQYNTQVCIIRLNCLTITFSNMTTP